MGPSLVWRGGKRKAMEVRFRWVDCLNQRVGGDLGGDCLNQRVGGDLGGGG